MLPKGNYIVVSKFHFEVNAQMCKSELYTHHIINADIFYDEKEDMYNVIILEGTRHNELEIIMDDLLLRNYTPTLVLNTK